MKLRNNMKKRFYITTPIYYASGNLHIGHLYTTALTWVIANYKKLDGYDVRMLTGSDEHGLKIKQKAEEKGVKPQEFVDELALKFQQMWKDFRIEYDYYSRTTSQYHKKTIQDIFSYFLKKEFVYKGKYQGLYSIPDEEFLTETQAIKKNGKFYHPTSDHELTLVSEESYFFKMNLFQDWLVDYINKNKEFLAPKKIENEMINNFISKGLEDLSITRAKIDWGIKINEDPSHTVYVWLDALANYITALGFDINGNHKDDFKYFWEDDNAEVVHLIGKEISRFHMIYWPIFLKALNLKLPSKIQSHGWIITPTGKMSKSKNNIIDPYKLLEKYDPEIIKYFFVSQSALGDDIVFDEERFVNTINAELINTYGNLIARTLKMKSNSFSNPIKYAKTTYQEDLDIENDIINSIKEYKNNFDEFRINKAFQIANELGNQLNKYIDLTKPWTITNLDRLEQILVRLLNGIYALSTYYSVVLPNKVSEVATALDLKEFKLDEIKDFTKFNDKKLTESFILYKRLKFN
ncbi:methionine--tRNA ligase [Mycoplasma sp. CSL10166]|nr:methionine--tRNA ligase [Mycoplasma sp. CSL10166]